MPKQRIGWNDYKVDYSEFSDKIGTNISRNHYWLMMGLTGPRRPAFAIEHLANVRGSSCYFIDLDPRFVKRSSRTSNSMSRAPTWITSWIKP